MRSAPDLSVPPTETVLPFILNVITGSADAGLAGALAPPIRVMPLTLGVAAFDAASGTIDKASAAATGAASAIQRLGPAGTGSLVRNLFFLVNTRVIPSLRGRTRAAMAARPVFGPWHSGPRRGPTARTGSRCAAAGRWRPRGGPLVCVTRVCREPRLRATREVRRVRWWWLPAE